MADAQHADHSGSGNATMDLQPEFLKLPGHEVAGPMFLEAQLRMGVQVPAPARQLAMHRLDAVIDLHRSLGSSTGHRLVNAWRAGKCIPADFAQRWEPHRAAVHYPTMVCRPDPGKGGERRQ